MWHDKTLFLLRWCSCMKFFFLTFLWHAARVNLKKVITRRDLLAKKNFTLIEHGQLPPTYIGAGGELKTRMFFFSVFKKKGRETRVLRFFISVTNGRFFPSCASQTTWSKGNVQKKNNRETRETVTFHYRISSSRVSHLHAIKKKRSRVEECHEEFTVLWNAIRADSHLTAY